MPQVTHSETADSGRFLELLAVAVASGSTIRSAAEQAGCSERQGYRVASSPEFKTRVSELRNEMTAEAVGKLSAAASEAVATIRELLSKEYEPAIRLNASKSILTQLGPITESHELRQRIDALEAQR